MNTMLGFGTAPVLGRVGRKESVRAIESAYDLGIRHFDTARSYGWGEAEGLLGSLLAHRPRDSYVLVSKCGIVPARRSQLLSSAKTVAREIYKRVPVGRALIRRAASAPAFAPTRTYHVPTLQASLDTSLRELRTDHLDALLLHNFAPGTPLDDVLAWFQRERQAGRIRRFGFSIEGNLLEGLECLSRAGALPGAALQVPVSDALFELPEKWRSAPMVVHSLMGYSAKHPEKTRQELFKALVGRAEAIVLSMFSSAHQHENLALMANLGLSRVTLRDPREPPPKARTRGKDARRCDAHR